MSSVRPIAFWTILLAIVVLFAECMSFVALSVLRGEWYDLQDIDNARAKHTSIDMPDLRGVNTDPSSFFGGYPTYLHPYLGFTLKPSTDVEADDQGIAMEAFGFPHGGRMVRERESEDFIIAILGGSVAQNLITNGYGGPALVRALQKERRFAGKNIQFTSLATGGFKEPQHILALSYALSLGAQFDMVINLSGFNEVTLPFRENIPAGLHPLYPRSWQLLAGGLTQTQLADIGRIALLRQSRASFALLSRRAGCNWSYTCGALWHSLDHLMARGIARANARIVLQDKEGVDDPAFAGPPMGRGGSGAALTEIVATWERSAALIEELGRSHGFRAFTFLQPSPYYGSKTLSLEEKKMLLPGTWPDIYTDRGYPALQNSVRSLRVRGYHAQDLTEVFQDHPETVYVDACCHTGAHGDAILSEAIAQEILRAW